MRKTLLEKAKSIKTLVRNYKKFTNEDLELVLGWINNEVTAAQMCKARGMKRITGNYLYYCASVLKTALWNKKIKIIKI